jgi:pimeloyl-ACP methyl ester carboxylesterase
MMVAARPVELALQNGLVLRGQQWGDGPDWIILLHDIGEDRDLDDWRPLLPVIMSGERTLLTLDLPGHGASDGVSDITVLCTIIDEILAFARSRNAAWIAVAGAGRTAAVALEAAGQTPIDALLLISPEIGPGRAEELRGRGEPKLFAVGSRIESLNTAAREARNRSIGWAMLVSLPTEAQGTSLLGGPYSSQLTERIVAFLAEQRVLTRTMKSQLSTSN